MIAVDGSLMAGGEILNVAVDAIPVARMRRIFGLKTDDALSFVESVVKAAPSATAATAVLKFYGDQYNARQ